MKSFLPIRFAVTAVCLAAMFVMLTLASFDSTFATDEGWFSSSSPTFRKDLDLASANDLPTEIGNTDCTNRTVITRPAKLLQSEVKRTGCFIDTTYGIADGTGFIKFRGTNTAGKVVNWDGSSGFIPIPNSSDVMHASNSGGNTFVRFTRSIPAPFSINIASTGEVTYRFTSNSTDVLRNGNGSAMPLRGDTIGFSQNGEWMIVDSATAVLRVNTKTKEILPFAPTFNYGVGLAPHPQLAITDDGRFAVVVSKNFGIFRLYDLSTCASAPTVINGPVNCQSRDLLPFVQSNIDQFSGAVHVRFINNDTFSFYGTHKVDNISHYAKYTIFAPGIEPKELMYLAMGDSFASGEGDMGGALYYEPGTDVDENKCHLSRRSYPYLINEYLGLADFHSVACSGAKTNNVTGLTKGDIQHTDTSDTTPLGAWIPGYQAQIKYLNGYTPEFLTVSIGGNDVGFADKLTECVTSGLKAPIPTTCKYAADLTERANIAKEIADQFTSLKNVYNELIKATGEKTKIYAVGYPQFVKGSGGTCGLNVGLNDEERYFVEKATGYMNQVIRAAAASAGVHYVDTERALENRNLCSIVADEEMVVNGITYGDDKELPWWAKIAAQPVLGVVPVSLLELGNESFHPNQNGHLLMKNKILELTNNNPMSYEVCPSNPDKIVCPSDSNHIPVPDVGYFGGEAVDYVEQLNTSSGSNLPAVPNNVKLIVGSTPETRQVQIKSELLKPNSQVTVIVQSEPTEIGTYIVDSAGTLDTQITIPETVEAGYHTLHVMGTNIAGEPIHYYEHIFVPGPEGDINGNGIPDTDDKCGFVRPANQDIDMDGIDDACDGFISSAPMPPRVQITNPADGTIVDNTITIDVSVEDAKGVAGVQFILDGNNLGSELTTAPYSYVWDTKSTTNGNHTVSVVARNVNGRTSTATITVNVQNKSVQPPNDPPIIKLIKTIVKAVVNLVTSLITKLFR